VKQYSTFSVENFKKSVLNAGDEVLGLYLPEVKKYLTYSVKNFKKTVLQAGGEDTCGI